MTRVREKEFKQLLATYGSQTDRWPDDQREAALIFADTESGQALLQAEEAFDGLLMQSAKSEEASDDFIRILLALPDQTITQSQNIKKNLLARWRQQLPELALWLNPKMLAAEAATLATALVMGIWIGGQQAIAEDETFETDLSYVLLSEDLIVEDDMESWDE